MQPIIGAQFTVDFSDAPAASRLNKTRAARAPLVVIAQNEAGYRALMRLASRVWLDPKDGDEPHIGFDALDESAASSPSPAGRRGRSTARWRWALTTSPRPA